MKARIIMGAASRVRPGIVFGALVIGLLGLLSVARAGETIVVDVGAPGRPAQAQLSGFIHGMDEASPVDALVDPLAPKLFRDRPQRALQAATLARLASKSSTIEITVSALLGPNAPVWPGDGGSYASWEAKVLALTKEAAAKGVHVYGIWNEPTVLKFWGPGIAKGSAGRAQFFETWRRTVTIIRANDPAAEIVGPSSGRYEVTAGDGAEFMKAFLDYAQQKNVLPDTLSWHELRPDANDIPVHVADIRAWMASHTPVITIPRIELNETVTPAHTFRPGGSLFALANLERARVDRAARACWRETPMGGALSCLPATPAADCVDTCDNLSLDGLLRIDKATGKASPRSVYWLYERYARMRGTFVRLAPSASVDGLASVDGSTVTVLVGNHGDASVETTIAFDDGQAAKTLFGGAAVELLEEAIPSSELASLPSPMPTVSTLGPSQALPTAKVALGPWGAALLTFRRKPGTAVDGGAPPADGGMSEPIGDGGDGPGPGDAAAPTTPPEHDEGSSDGCAVRAASRFPEPFAFVVVACALARRLLRRRRR